MGKRKRRADNNKASPPPPSDITPHAPQVDQLLERRSSELTESSATQSLASIMDAMDRSLKRSPGHQSPLNQNHGSSHAILLRHSHPRHYSRRSSTNHSDASPSNWKGTPVFDAKSSFKLEEIRERTFQKPERIRSSSLAQVAVSRDFRKMECRICQKRLRKNPVIFENNSIPSSDLSVVAVLVCGHTYHADCLDQKTSQEDRQDPPCPLCLNQTS